MAEKERIYVIPLRRIVVEAPRINRANRAVSEIKRYLSRHMHAEEVWISRGINEAVWKSGAKKPPAKIKVKARLEDNIVKAMLPDEKEPAKETKEEGKLGGIKEKLAAKTGLADKDIKEIEKKAEQAVSEGKTRPAKDTQPKGTGQETRKGLESEKSDESKKV